MQQPDPRDRHTLTARPAPTGEQGLRARLPRGIPSAAALLAVTACVLAAALLLAGGGGLLAGQQERAIRATETTAADIDLQFQLGLADMEQERYALAAQRFQWVLDRSPDYPGAADWLGVAQRMLDTSDTPDSPDAVPTSSARTLDERFAEAKALFDESRWDIAITRLQEIQTIDPAYREIEVKEMLYTALSTLGLQYVRGERIEEGILLLDQAQKIRPLDDQTAGERYVASLYVAGRTYWELNWPIVIDNFEAIYEIAPNYRDVAARLWEAYIRYGDQLVLQGTPCDAEEQYRTARNIRDDGTLSEKISQAQEACLNPSPTPSPTLLPGASPTEEVEETPTP
jgi:tetratricopeptide (TPR) repeat protein